VLVSICFRRASSLNIFFTQLLELDNQQSEIAMDTILSIVLIVIIGVFLFMFCLQTFKILMKMIRDRQKARDGSSKRDTCIDKFLRNLTFKNDKYSQHKDLFEGQEVSKKAIRASESHHERNKSAAALGLNVNSPSAGSMDMGGTGFGDFDDDDITMTASPLAGAGMKSPKSDSGRSNTFSTKTDAGDARESEIMEGTMAPLGEDDFEDSD
jgi:hypothetical protein